LRAAFRKYFEKGMMSQVRKVNYVRAMIIIQSLVTAWFYFSPDRVPEVLRQAELANDRPLYEMLDLIVICLVYFQAAFCLALWWPTWTISWLYLLSRNTHQVIDL